VNTKNKITAGGMLPVIQYSSRVINLGLKTVEGDRNKD
jgi:hypothetical protein